MPVTAKLSRKFYKALGDDIANALVERFNQVDATYRADLIKWMFGFWIGTLAPIAGLLVLLTR